MNEEIEYSIKDLSENFEHFNVDVSSFLEKGNNSKNPMPSVKKPGIINSKAAKAIDAPDINS